MRIVSIYYKRLIIIVVVSCASVGWGLHYIKALQDNNFLRARIASMSIAEKIGQLVMMGVYSKTMTDDLKNSLDSYMLGGVILFGHALESQEQIFDLISAMQELSVGSAGTPLLVAVDQEGGKVNRVLQGLTHIPGNMALTAAGSVKLARMAGEINGMELRRLGINLNLAPCVDVLKYPANEVIGTRSFGAETIPVSRFAQAYFKGLKKYNVLGCAKHFPNHGAVKADSHRLLPRSALSRDDIKKDLLPYHTLIKSNIDMIMLAHINWQTIDNNALPGTFSETVICNLLREELGFDGVVVSDSLDMKAITRYYSLAEASVKFINAGGDLIIIGGGYHNVRKVVDGLKEALRSGVIDEVRINESVYRILKLKMDVFDGLAYERTSLHHVSIDWESNRHWASTIASKSIRRYGNWGSMPVITEDTSMLLVGASSAWSAIAQNYFSDVTFFKIPVRPRKSYQRARQLKELLSKGSYAVCVVVCENAYQSAWYQRVLGSRKEPYPRVMVFSEDLSCMQNAYYRQFPIVLLWGPSEYSRRAALEHIKT